MASTVVSLDLAFRDNQELRSAYHGFANLINVIHAELQLLERMAEGDAGLRPTIRLCEAATWSFKDSESATDNATGLFGFRNRILEHIRRIVPMQEYREDVDEARELICSVLDEADLRIQEMLARHGVSRPFVRLNPAVASSAILQAAGEDPRVQLRARKEIDAPIGLPEILGRFALAVAELTEEEVHVSISMASGGPFSASVTSASVSGEIIPSAPPSAKEPLSTAGKVEALVALLSYVAGPAATVTVNPTGEPLLQIRFATE